MCFSCSFIFQIPPETTNAKPISKSLENVSICSSEISRDDLGLSENARSLDAVNDADDEWSSSPDSLTSDEDSESISLASWSSDEGNAVKSSDEESDERVESSSLITVTELQWSSDNASLLGTTTHVEDQSGGDKQDLAKPKEDQDSEESDDPVSSKGLLVKREDLVNAHAGSSFVGRGATSNISLMKLRTYDYLVAVKQLLPTEARSTLIKEVRVLRKLQNSLAFPNLIGFIDEQQPSIVMEFVGDWQICTSSSVFDALNTFNPRLSTAEWLRVARNVARGLGWLHTIGYLHGDLHNENIMLCRYPYSRDPLERWQAKIIDLGSSEAIDSPSEPLQLSEREKVQWREGCPYKAPELIDGTTGHTTATDKYAYGFVIDDIGFFRDIKILSTLGKKCMNTDPEMRPNLKDVARELLCKEALYKS